VNTNFDSLQVPGSNQIRVYAPKFHVRGGMEVVVVYVVSTAHLMREIKLVSRHFKVVLPLQKCVQ